MKCGWLPQVCAMFLLVIHGNVCTLKNVSITSKTTMHQKVIGANLFYSGYITQPLSLLL